MSLLLLALLAAPHETRPAYLEIRELAPEQYRVLWKTPAREEYRLAIRPRFPDGSVCGPRSVQSTGDYCVERFDLRCPGGLLGRELSIDGLTSTVTDVLVRVEDREGRVRTALLKPGRPSFPVPAIPSAREVSAAYFTLGVEHILLGVDHLLFVLGLLFLVRTPKRLLATVTAFTAAHSLTLAASTLGWIRVPSRPVEAVIALSIVFVALEILRAREGKGGLAQERPWVVALSFGLLHGFGFAGALAEVGLPVDAVPLALLFFNLGVEAGQLLFVGVVAATWAGLSRLAPGLARSDCAWKAPAYAIGGLAVFWTLERTLG